MADNILYGGHILKNENKNGGVYLRTKHSFIDQNEDGHVLTFLARRNLRKSVFVEASKQTHTHHRHNHRRRE